MSEFNLEELLAIEGLAYWIEVHLLWLVAALYLAAAWKFLRSPDRPPHPQRYRRGRES